MAEQEPSSLAEPQVSAQDQSLQADSPTKKTKPLKRKKKKVEMACVYCRRSHMICDDTRPCQRCIKRGIGHLCYDEPSNSRQRQKVASMKKGGSSSSTTGGVGGSGNIDVGQPILARPDDGFSPQPTSPSSGVNTPRQLARVSTSQSTLFPENQSLSQYKQLQTMHNQNAFISPQFPVLQHQHLQPQQQQQQKPNSVLSQTLTYNQEPFFYSEHAGSEFSSLNDFLSMIDDPELVNGSLNDAGGDPLLQFGMGSRMNMNSNNNNNNNNQLEIGGSAANIGNENSNSLSNILAYSPGGASVFPQSLNETKIQDSLNQPQQQISYMDQLQQQQQLQQQEQQQQQPQVQSQTGNTAPQSVHTSLYSYSKAPYGASNVSNTNNNKNNNDNTNDAQNSSHQPVISDSARDKFFLTAADPTTEISPEERLKQVIKAKLDAGLLQPYNYAKGYARLQSYMDNYMNVSSRQRILKPLQIFRPAFRAIARTLKDVDLVLVEESFERMLLDYDRVFTSMAIPACLWRRTGEIYRGNKEFALLVGVSTDDLKDGKLAIYELMSEDSAVNFWEKYGAIAFDKGQKAVLTSCNLRTKDGIKRKSCCFSFTIRRDRYNIPSCIVGNFIPIDPTN